MKHLKKNSGGIDWWKALGVKTPVPEYRFAPPRLWRFDFAWVDEKIAVEIEGGIWIQGRHSRGAGMLKDMEKYNEAAFRGWKVFRFTPQQYGSGEAAVLIKGLFDKLKGGSK